MIAVLWLRKHVVYFCIYIRYDNDDVSILYTVTVEI